jgi:hypothetical protein
VCDLTFDTGISTPSTQPHSPGIGAALPPRPQPPDHPPSCVYPSTHTNIHPSCPFTLSDELNTNRCVHFQCKTLWSCKLCSCNAGCRWRNLLVGSRGQLRAALRLGTSRACVSVHGSVVCDSCARIATRHTHAAICTVRASSTSRTSSCGTAGMRALALIMRAVHQLHMQLH